MGPQHYTNISSSVGAGGLSRIAPERVRVSSSRRSYLAVAAAMVSLFDCSTEFQQRVTFKGHILS